MEQKFIVYNELNMPVKMGISIDVTAHDPVRKIMFQSPDGCYLLFKLKYDVCPTSLYLEFTAGDCYGCEQINIQGNELNAFINALTKDDEFYEDSIQDTIPCWLEGMSRYIATHITTYFSCDWISGKSFDEMISSQEYVHLYSLSSNPNLAIFRGTSKSCGASNSDLGLFRGAASYYLSLKEESVVFSFSSDSMHINNSFGCFTGVHILETIQDIINSYGLNKQPPV